MNEEIDLNDLGLRIKSAREEAHLTQCQLHDITGISITQISGYENGTRSIGLVSLQKIAEATNKTMDEIYNGKVEQKPIKKSFNKGELIVNCVSALVEQNVITSLPKQKENEFVPSGSEFYYRIAFQKYVYILDDLVSKLIDFENNITNYPDPQSFKKQLLAAASNQINAVKEWYICWFLFFHFNFLSILSIIYLWKINLAYH